MPKYTINGDIRSFASKSCELKTRWQDATYAENMGAMSKEIWTSSEVRAIRSQQQRQWWTDHPEEREKRAMRLFGASKAKIESGRRTNGEAAIEAALLELGIAYLFEHRIGRYIVDFAFPALNAIIECDGNFHRINPEREKVREEWLLSQGWRTLHLTVDQAIGRRQTLINRIKTFLPL